MTLTNDEIKLRSDHPEGCPDCGNHWPALHEPKVKTDAEKRELIKKRALRRKAKGISGRRNLTLCLSEASRMDQGIADLAIKKMGLETGEPIYVCPNGNETLLLCESELTDEFQPTVVVMNH